MAFQPLAFQPNFQQVGASEGAGRAKRRRRYFVEVDGQQFDVDSVEQARQILQKAKALAEVEAPKVAEQTVQRIQRIGTAHRIEVPKVTASPELAEIVYPYRKAIQKAYNDAAQTAELRMLLEAKFREDDDDDIFILMM